MRLTEACIRKPVMAWMLMFAVLAVGGLSWWRLGVSQYPDIDKPQVSVSLSLLGAAPEVMERDVVEPLEERLAQIEGVTQLSAYCRRGSAYLILTFDLSRDIDAALQDVQNKISGTRGLPRDLDPPIVNKSNPEDDPILWITIGGPFSPQILADVARYQVADRLATIPGVGEISGGGGMSRNLRVWLDAQRLAAQGLTAAEVLAAIGRNHLEQPAGRMQAGGREVDVRVLGEAGGIEAFRDLVVAARPQAAGPPAVVRLRDVALVEDGFADDQRIIRRDGELAQGLGVRKVRGANAVEVAAAVRGRLAEIQRTLPAGMTLVVNVDATRFISASVHEMQRELLTAVALTALVCWLFLGSFTAAANILLAIPLSLFGTLAVLHACGLTLNTFTLLGLALAIGLVVDDAIMVQENIMRHRALGLTPMAAARKGTREIAFAALAASVAVVAVFSPVLFMGGEIGRSFLHLGVALCVAVMLSYVEAVTLAPARLAHLGGALEPGRFGRWVERGLAHLGALYGRLLGPVVRNPWPVLLGGLAVSALGLGLALRLPREFLPPQDAGMLDIRFSAATGSEIAETDALARRVETLLARRADFARIFTNVGSGGNSEARIRVVLAPRPERKGVEAIRAEVRRELGSIPGIYSLKVDDASPPLVQTSSGTKAVDLSLRGSEWNALISAHDALMPRLRADSAELADVASDYRLGAPELQVIPDRDRCAELDVPIETVASTVGILVGGQRAGTFSLGGRRQDVLVRVRADQRATAADLGRFLVRTRSGVPVPLSSLVRFEERPALTQITRKDRDRAISISAGLPPGVPQATAQAAVLAHAQAALKDLPGSVRAIPGESAAATESALWGLLFALAGGILAAYMVLGAQFNSFVHPITILCILPMAVAGAAIALWLGGSSLNTLSVIGVLLLMGIAKKNSIILVDVARQIQLDEAKTTAAAAMLRAGPLRLRPILMTSAATAMAAVPIAFGHYLGLGAGSEVRAPMGLAVLGGVVLSTVLSLVVVPAFYVLMDRLVRRLRGSRTDAI